MKPAARIGDPHACPAFQLVPHFGGPLSHPGETSVQVEGAAGGRFADFATCGGSPLDDVVSQGAASVLIGQLPAARADDGTIHGGRVEVGAGKVFIGGPTFSIPSNISVVGFPDFQNKVLRDLFFLSTTPSGKEMLRRLEASGETIIIIPTSDDKGSATPINIFGGRTNTTGSVIQYNPDWAPAWVGPGPTLIPTPPQVVLAHEMGHALANAEGRRETKDIDPVKNPNNEPTKLTEAQAMGTGSHARDYPTENSLREDLGLPPRADHRRSGESSPPPANLRPGKY